MSMFTTQPTYTYFAAHPPPRSHGKTCTAFSDSAKAGEDWTKVKNAVERRKIQNRIAQRNYRKKLKKRIEDLESRVGCSDNDASDKQLPFSRFTPPIESTDDQSHPDASFHSLSDIAAQSNPAIIIANAYPNYDIYSAVSSTESIPYDLVVGEVSEIWSTPTGERMASVWVRKSA